MIKKLVLLAAVIVFGVSLAQGYEITRFTFGPYQYALSEPTPDFTRFKIIQEGLAVKEDNFVIVVREGHDEKGNTYVFMLFCAERQPDDSTKLVIMMVMITENISDSAKINTRAFVNKQYLETGVVGFDLVKMEKAPDLDKFIALKKALSAPKMSL